MSKKCYSKGVRMKQNELIVRIDERVKTIFNDLHDLKLMQEESNKRHYQCQTEILPIIKTKIKVLEQRPIGLTAFIMALLKGLR